MGVYIPTPPNLNLGSHEFMRLNPQLSFHHHLADFVCDSTEPLIMAEQALSTRAIEAAVYHIGQEPMCRLRKEASKTVQHIVSGYNMGWKSQSHSGRYLQRW